jgi:hypothetical protein
MNVWIYIICVYLTTGKDSTSLDFYICLFINHPKIDQDIEVLKSSQIYAGQIIPRAFFKITDEG